MAKWFTFRGVVSMAKKAKEADAPPPAVPEVVRRYFSKIGTRGGSAVAGVAKRRDKSHYAKLAVAREAARKARKEEDARVRAEVIELRAEVQRLRNEVQKLRAKLRE
jgi:histidinol dehydrogenase